MKIKFRYIIICVLILVMFKAIEMYKNVYPQFTSKYCGNVTEFSYRYSELNYDLFFSNDLEEDQFNSKTYNIFLENNTWDKKVLIGQHLYFIRFNDRYTLHTDLFISDYNLPMHIIKNNFKETDFREINDNRISLDKGDYNRKPDELSYYFNFQLKDFYIYGYLSYQSLNELSFLTDHDRIDFVGEYLTQVFFSQKRSSSFNE